MLFHIRPMAAKGSSSSLKRSQEEKRKMAEASFSSLGMVVMDW